MSFRQTLISSCAPFGIVLTDGQLDLCEKYFDMLVETNRSMNLTAITDPDQAAVLHFSDSLALLKYIDIPRSARLIDVGTGAGFPGLPLKIARNDIDLTLLDALNKRLGFLQSVLYNTGLTAGLLHSRAEDAGRDPAFRESFDVAVCRAVAKLNVLAEYCLPLLKCEGVFVAMKSGDIDEEISLAQNALRLLNGEISDIHRLELADGSKRSLVVIKKLSPNDPCYPRSSSKISKKPL